MAIKTLTKLAVPKEPNTIYTFPALSTWLFYTLRNRNILSRVHPQFIESRNELISLAINYTKDLTGKDLSYRIKTPVIATGHQPCWHHCGIFIKSLIGFIMAKKMEGLFIHVVLDHDMVDTSLQLPDKKTLDLAKLSFLKLNGHEHNIPLERIRPDYQSVLDFLIHSKDASLQNALLKHTWDVNHFNNGFDQYRSISDCIVYLLDLLYQSAGVNMIYLPVSRIAESMVFQEFCEGVFLDVLSFTRHYNDIVSTTTGFAGISTLRTKLIQGHAFTELPLWLLTPENNRETLWVSIETNNILMVASEFNVLATTPKTEANLLFQMLQQIKYSIRPKAALLTCFLRLYLCDWFIHGIGGSRYEPISDYLLKHYWKINGVTYGSTALTSYLFEKERNAAKTNLNNLFEQQRKYTHKPETLFYSDQNPESKARYLMQEKETLVSRSNNHALPSHERKIAWGRIKQINQKMQILLPCTEESLHSNIGKLEEQLSILQKRDFFFGLFSQEYLNSFFEVINAELS